MQQISENAYNYYVKLLFGIIGTFFSFLIQFLNENECHFTNSFKGTGLKHCGCELFSAVVPALEHLCEYPVMKVGSIMCVPNMFRSHDHVLMIGSEV